MSRAARSAAGLLGLLAGALLLACATRGTEVREYVLSSSATAAPSDAPGRNLVIGVGPVSLPPYLRREELVTRVGANELRASDTHRWGEALDRGLARVVAESLAVRVPATQVYPFPWQSRARTDYRVSIDVDRFERMPDGSVVLEARWALMRGNAAAPVDQGSASIRKETAGPTAADTVAAMSSAADRLSQQIADAIRARAGLAAARGVHRAGATIVERTGPVASR